MIEEAEAYKAEVIARAEGESDRFESLLAEYKRAPEVTRERLYLETMESVMTRSSKVMVDVAGGNNMLYLPLDRMGNRQPAVEQPVQTENFNSRALQPTEPTKPLVRREMR